MQAQQGFHTSAVDWAMVHLVRLVVDDHWEPVTASEQLHDLVGDESVLRQSRARVMQALADQTTSIGERALATVDGALASSEPYGGPSTLAGGLSAS